MVAATTTLTPADLLAMPDDGRIYELINGELAEIEMSAKSSRIAMRIGLRLGNHIEARKAGDLYGIDAGFTCFPDSPGMVRKPDLAFIAAGRMTPEEMDEDGYCSTVPDLVVEVNSPNDLAYDVNRKCELWLAAGVKLVWVVDPATESVFTFHADGRSEHFRRHQTIHARPVLEGFECPVAEFFARG
jgi:Uma2 family endonuclease